MLEEHSMPSPQPGASLTEVEQIVLSQVIEGKTSKEIAAVLHRSPRTVEVHRLHILRKLGVSSTRDLMIQMIRLEAFHSIHPHEPEYGADCLGSPRELAFT